MFSTMGSFLTFFFITLALIVLGILFEEKLIRFERAVRYGTKKTIKDYAQNRA